VQCTVWFGKKDCTVQSNNCSKWPLSAQMHNLTHSTMESVTSLRTVAPLTHLTTSKICLSSSSHVHLAVTHVFHVTTHMEVRQTDIQWPWWPTVQTTMADPLVRDLLIQIQH